MHSRDKEWKRGPAEQEDFLIFGSEEHAKLAKRARARRTREGEEGSVEDGTGAYRMEGEWLALQEGETTARATSLRV